MILNFKNLSKSPLREKALLIANAGYEAINIEKVVKQKINIEKNIKKFAHVFVLGIGKGAALATAALVKKLGGRLTKAVALDIQRPKPIVYNSRFKILVGSHPLPSKKNVRATREIIKLLKSLSEKDLLITFICGGGSALLCGSEKEMKNSQFVFKKLTRAGADIVEMNTIRKHLSKVKGGGLAKTAYPATIVSFIASDVLGNDISMVASGPFVFDKTTKRDAETVWKKYVKKNAPFEFLETPKSKGCFKKVKNILFVSNKDVISAMSKKARQLKLKPKIYSLKLKGEAKNAMVFCAEPLKKEKNGGVVLAGGETTVVLKGKNIGKGGRNQEAVLGAIVNLTGKTELKMNNYVFLSFASDGRDNTEAAGAIGDGLTIQKADRLKLDRKKYLERHDSFNFFKKTGDLIYADKNSFNVSDIMLVLSPLK